MEATRLAPAGRACSKFVWQSRFLTTGRFECFGIRAARSFLPSPADAARGLPVGVGPRTLAASAVSPRHRPAPSKKDRRISRRDFMRPCSKCALPVFRPGPLFKGLGAGLLRPGPATLLPRLGVTPRGGNAADGGGRPTSNPWAGGRPFTRFAGPEFVSEFETKRDQ
jgi:hypothetical protein